MMLCMNDNKTMVTGKYSSRTKTWTVVAKRDGRKATAKGLKLTSTHRAALTALSLMEKIAEDDVKEDLPVVPSGPVT